MKGLDIILSLIVWAASLIVALLLLFSAFSPYIIQPVKYPVFSLAGFVFPLLVVLNLLLLLLFLLFRGFKYALIPLIALGVCYSQLSTYLPLNSPADTKPEGGLKLLSYNTMSFSSMVKSDGKNAVLDYLNASEADIICLQEHMVSSNSRYVTQKDVDKVLSAYPYRAGKTADGKKSMSYMAVYSKLPVIKTERITMQSSSNGAMAYHLKWGQDTLLLVNCHLESNKLTTEDKEMYEEMIEKHEKEQVKAGLKVLVKKLAEASAIRAPQADSIADYLLRHPNKYTIVCGDFNDIPISYTHHILTRTLNDAFTESGRGFGVSYHNNKFLFRIDNILVGAGLRATNCTVDSSIDASDHYPIWAYVEKN